MRDKPNYCYASGCPLAEKGRGFVLGTGDPKKAKMALILETPSNDDVGFQLTLQPGRRFLSTQAEIDAELARRKVAYPDIDVHLLKRGAPIVGAAGAMLGQWIFAPTGVKRDDIFIDNTLRCLPPKVKNKAYPTGTERLQAEKCCRAYDRLDEFKPDALVMTMHPQALLQEITPLPLMLKDMEKVQDFIKSGLRTAVLMGGNAAKAFARYGQNIARWRGSYELVGKQWYTETLSFFDRVASKKKVSKKELFALAAEDPNDPFASFLGDVRLKRVATGERLQCVADVPKKGQCTRKSQPGSKYCGTHRKKFESAAAVEESK